MRLTFFVVWKSWVSNPLRTALSVLGVALGVAIVTAIHVIDHNTIESRLRLMRPDFGRVDLELMPLQSGRAPADVRNELASHPDVGAVGVLQQGIATVTAPSGREFAVPVFGLSPLPTTSFAHYLVREGEDLSDLDGESGVLIGQRLAKLAEVSPGDRLIVARPAAAVRTRCVQGERIVVDPSQEFVPFSAEVVVKGILADSRLGARNENVVLVSSFSLARDLAPQPRPLYQINRKAGVDVDRLRQELAADFDVLDNRSALLGEKSDERAFRNGVKVLGCLALVLGMFVIFQTLSQSLVERLKQIGLLRALGTGRRTIGSVFLLDASATATLGTALGIGGGIALAYGLQRLNFSTLGRGKRIVTFELPAEPLLWTAVIGITFTLMGAAFPLWKARNLPALDVLAARGMRAGSEGGETYVLRGVNVFLFAMLVLVLPGAYLAMTPILSEEGREARIVLIELGAMILLFGGVLLMAPRLVQILGRILLAPFKRVAPLSSFLVVKAMQQSPGRFAAAVCGLSVVLMAMLALKSITSGLSEEARQFGRGTMQDRLFVKCDPVNLELAQRLYEIDGVAGGEFYEGRVDVRFPLRGVPADRLAGEGALWADDPAAAQAYREQRGLVISTRLAHLRGKGAGDTISLVTDEGPVDYQVLAVSDRFGFFPDERAWAIASPRWLRRDFCADARIDRMALRLEPGAPVHAVLNAVRDVLPSAPWAKTGRELTAYSVRDIGLDFFLFDVLLGLILLLAGIGLVNTMTIAALGRTREIGVLRALGMSKRALRATFLMEGGVVALLSAALSVGLAVPLGMIVMRGLNEVAGLQAPYIVPWRYVGLVPLLACATGVLAAILPGVRALRESPAEAVRYE